MEKYRSQDPAGPNPWARTGILRDSMCSWLSFQKWLLISRIRRHSMFRSGLPTSPQRRTAQRDSLPRLKSLLSPCNQSVSNPVVAICAHTRSQESIKEQEPWYRGATVGLPQRHMAIHLCRAFQEDSRRASTWDFQIK